MTGFFAHPRDLAVAGGPVRVFRGGRRDAPALLLLHGAMLDTGRGVWRRVAAELANDYDVHVIDLPRHGGSRPWSGTLDHAFFMQFIDELLDALELRRVTILGLSMGGGIAAGYALEHPERVDAVVTVGPGGIGARRPAQFSTWLTLRTPGVLRAAIWYLARFPATIRTSMHRHLVAGERTRDFDQIVADASEEAIGKHSHGERALDDWQIRAYGPFGMRLDMLPRLSAMTRPSLWIRGDRDALVSADVIVAAADAAPDSRSATIADAGHVVTYDQPERFLDVARPFIAQHARQRDAF